MITFVLEVGAEYFFIQNKRLKIVLLLGYSDCAKVLETNFSVPVFLQNLFDFADEQIKQSQQKFLIAFEVVFFDAYHMAVQIDLVYYSHLLELTNILILYRLQNT